MCWPFERQPNKMVKHAQTIRWQKRCLSVFDCFLGLALKGLNKWAFRTLWNIDDATLCENSLRQKAMFAKNSIINVWHGLWSK